ncbi:Nuclear pore complex protein NUP50B [Cardamine amara subsp. amara]|uniref:Nuclear pore complex protein NUP50B n=1 Tax=Cardamine amara subsp. amara TaxID=228776 RepID=A0ABD0Z9I3_CARAN
MGDSVNAQQPSKKRAALKELSRDNPGLDDEEDTSALESGTFKTASEEVLASRRIVRVKRRDPSAAAPAPASNPFAGIRLVPFTAPAPAPSTTTAETTKPLAESISTPSEGTQETQHVTKETDGDNKDKSEAIDAVGKQETQDDERSDTNKQVIDGSEAVNTGEDGGAENEIEDKEKTTAEIEDDAGEATEKAKDDNDNSEIVKETACVDKDSGDNQTEKERKEGGGNKDTEKNGDSGALSSFQQHSSNKNAFTGLASTGFSTSSFSFGLVPQEGLTGSGSGSLTEQSTFSFGLANNGNSSLFGASSSTSITTKSAETTTAFPSKQDVSVETGEEDEKAAFTADSIMFEYLEGGWKERGKGELKVNISTTDNRKARLVMRSRGNYRLILNASLYPEMKLASMDKKGISFACVNSITEAKNVLSTFALKFKDPTVVEEFRAVIEAHKDSKPAIVEAAAPLKTPENSPRAGDA